MTDVNAYLSRWPFRRLPSDEPGELVSALRQKGVRQAWAGTFDGLLHRDLSSANARLAADCAAYGKGFLVPFGSVNPAAPGWQEDLRRIHEVHRMPGIRLHPNYHRYRLSDKAAADLLATAASLGLIVQVALNMEDERTEHPLLRVPPVDPLPLGSFLRIPRLRLMLLNVRQFPKTLAGCYADLAMAESPYGLQQMIAVAGRERVVFGSYSPFFYFDSAYLKLTESALPAEDARLVTSANAAALLPGRSASATQ